ncbi:MAG TPA: glycosyltransferase family 4 protein [Terriglobales bacterium]|nr:glycosyltransferase family 4 protein [Terriglobales bacterium]
MPITVLSVAYPLAGVSPSTAGGAEQVLLTLDQALVRLGHRSLVLAAAGSKCHGLLVPVQVPSGVLDDRARREAQQQFQRALDWTLQRYRVDVVHMHGLDFDRYLPHGEVPAVVSLHLPLEWYRPAALRPNRPHTSLICVSHSQARTASPDVQIAGIIPNGVDLESFQPKHRLGDYALVLARICPEKGIDLAIEAASKAGVRLVLGGTLYEYPEHRQYFDSAVKPRLNHSARFIGAVGGKRKSQLLAGARCLLVPSLARETGSLIAMEAMACGTPVIAWRSGALPEIVCHGRTGFLVASVKEMAEAIANAASIHRNECRREAERRFSAERMISQYLDLYREVQAQNPATELQAA